MPNRDRFDNSWSITDMKPYYQDKAVTPKFKVARVYWWDASHYSSTESIEWLRDEASQTKVVTVGFVLKVSRQEIIVAHEITDNKARDTSIIPRKMVMKIEYLQAIL